MNKEVNQDLTQTIRNYLIESFVPDEPPENLPSDLDLIKSGILDSLAIVETATFLEGLIGSEIEAHELTPKNIGTIDAIVGFVRARRNHAAS